MAQANDGVDEGQQHPLSVYVKVWIWLFVLSAFSYAVDYYNVQGYPRWTLILIFMFLKAGLILAIFMHMAWERLALVYAVGVPVLAVLVFTFLMTHEADYTNDTRGTYFVGSEP